MLSSVLDSLRAWPAVRRSALSLLLPPGAGRLAHVLDLKVARSLRALGYTVVRGPVAAAEPLGLLAAALRKNEAAPFDCIATVRAQAGELATGGWLLWRAPLRERERVAAAFLHAGLKEVSQVTLRRSVLTAGQVST